MVQGWLCNYKLIEQLLASFPELVGILVFFLSLVDYLWYFMTQKRFSLFRSASLLAMN